MGRLTKGVLMSNSTTTQVIALSYGPDDNSSVRTEIRDGVALFVDYMYTNTDLDIATHIHQTVLVPESAVIRYTRLSINFADCSRHPRGPHGPHNQSSGSNSTISPITDCRTVSAHHSLAPSIIN
jgi:hypothetical protein